MTQVLTKSKSTVLYN